MPAGWRTLGAPKSKRNKDRLRRKLGKRQSVAIGDTESTDVGQVDTAIGRAEVALPVVSVPEQHDNDTKKARTPTSSIKSQHASGSESGSPLLPNCLSPKGATLEEDAQLELELEEHISPAESVKQTIVMPKSPSPEPETCSSTSSTSKLSSVEKSGTKTKKWQSLSLQYPRRAMKAKKRESPRKKTTIPTRKPKSPEQRAGAVQGIAVSWKNEFSNDAKKKIEQVKLSQLWKSFKASSSQTSSSNKKKEIPKKTETPKFRINHRKDVNISSTIPAVPPTGMTSKGGRSVPSWYQMNKSFSDSSQRTTPKFETTPTMSKLNPFVKEFTPKHSFNSVGNYNISSHMDQNRSQESSQPFVSQSSEIYNSQSMYNAKPLMMGSNPMMSVPSTSMGVATPRTPGYEFRGEQNVPMVNSMTMRQRQPQIGGASMVPTSNMHSFAMPYNGPHSGNTMPTPHWQGSAQPVMLNSGISPKLQQSFNSVQQQHGFSSSPTTITGFSSAFSTPTAPETSLPQMPSHFSSQYLHPQNQSLTAAKPNLSITQSQKPTFGRVQASSKPTFRFGQRLNGYQSKDTPPPFYNGQVLKPITRPILRKVPLPTQSHVQPRDQQRESLSITQLAHVVTKKTAGRLKNIDSPCTEVLKENWTLPKAQDGMNGFPTGMFNTSPSQRISSTIFSSKHDWDNTSARSDYSSESSSPQPAQPPPNFWNIPHTQVFSFLSFRDLAVLRRVSSSMSQKVRETPYITSMVVDGNHGIIGINTASEGKGKWVHDLENLMRLFTGRGVRTIELEPSSYVKFFWTQFLDWLTKDENSNVDSVLVKGEEEKTEDSGVREFLVGLSPREMKIRSGIVVDAKLLHELDRPGVKALVFSREIKWNSEMIQAVCNRVYPLEELTLACAPIVIVPWLSQFQRLKKLRLLHDPSNKSRLTDVDLVTILSTIRDFEVDLSLLSTRGLPTPTSSMVTTSLTILATCGESISRNWLEKSLKSVPYGLVRFHLKNLSEPLNLNHLDVPYKPSKANLQKLEGLSISGVQITGEECHDCRVLGLDYCLAIV